MKKFVFATIMVLACMISFDLLADCTGLSFDPAVDLLETSQGISPNKLATIDLTGIPSTVVGQLNMEFYPNDFDNESFTDYAAVGTYNLGTGNNTSFATCNQCVLLYFFDPNNDYAFVKEFYQQEGSLQITKNDFVENDHYYYEGVLTVKLAEAEVDEDTFATTFVTDGECYEIQTAAFSNFPADTGDTGDTGSDPVDTGDTGDTSGDPVDTGDTGDTEVPGDTDADTAADTEAPADDAPADTEAPADDTPADTDDAPADGDDAPAPAADEDEDDGGCALVTL